MLSDGMPVLWITLNPSDLRSTLVMELAGMVYEDSNQANSLNEFNRVTATMNPVAVALFFNAIWEGVFGHLLAASKFHQFIGGVQEVVANSTLNEYELKLLTKRRTDDLLQKSTSRKRLRSGKSNIGLTSEAADQKKPSGAKRKEKRARNALIGSLPTNETVKDAFPGGHTTVTPRRMTEFSCMLDISSLSMMASAPPLNRLVQVAWCFRSRVTLVLTRLRQLRRVIPNFFEP